MHSSEVSFPDPPVSQSMSARRGQTLRSGNILSSSLANFLSPLSANDMPWMNHSNCRLIGDTSSAHRLATAVPLIPGSPANSGLLMYFSSDKVALRSDDRP